MLNTSEVLPEINKQHPIYRNFYLMHYRVKNKNNLECYKHYQTKGVTICPEWNDFTAFVEDMYPTYVEGHVLDRIDNQGHYCKDNCQWLTNTQNLVKEIIKPVYQYSLKGEPVAEYASREAAANCCQGVPTGISRACNLLVPYKGSRWADIHYENGIPKELLSTVIAKEVPIRQVAIDTLEVIKEWASIQEASESLKIGAGSISQAANPSKSNLSAGGFLWFHSTDINTGETLEIVKVADPRNIPVEQLEIVQTANVVGMFSDLDEAVSSTPYTKAKLKRALNKEGSTYLGYIWRYNSLGLLEQCEYINEYKVLREFPSAAEAGRYVNASGGNITAVCKGKKTSVGGYAWRYKH